MIRRFLHIGDAHLDSASPRGADRVDALRQIVHHAQGLYLNAHESLDAIIWPGDLFDGESSTEDRNALSTIVQDLADCAPVFIVPGNHDRPRDLDIFAKLKSTHDIVLFDRPGVFVIPTAYGCASIFALPYVHKAGLVSSGTAHADLGADAAALLDPIFVQAAAELRAGQHIPLLAMHLNVGGAKTGPGQPSIGREIELTPALLARLPAGVAVMANHIHLHQEIHGAVYAGSIARMDFGENDPKGFVEWAFDDETRRWSWTFIPLDVPAQWLIDGRLTRDGFVPDAPLPVMTGADVKVRYRFTKAEHAVLDLAHLYADTAGCRSLKLEAVPELEHTVRAPEIAAAVTLEEKVARCAELQGVQMTDGLRSKLSAIQNQDASAILAALDETTAPLAEFVLLGLGHDVDAGATP